MSALWFALIMRSIAKIAHFTWMLLELFVTTTASVICYHSSVTLLHTLQGAASQVIIGPGTEYL